MSSIPHVTSKAEILIIDDQVENLYLLSSLLRQAGYHVRQSLNGEMALHSVRMKLPDLILLDVRMPGIDGYQLCEYFKSEDKICEIPVIFLSALNDIDSIRKGFQAGGIDYITKPFHIEEVLMRVGTQLQLHDLQKQLKEQNESLRRQIQLTQQYLQERQVAEDRRKLLEQAIVATQNGIVITDPNLPDNPIVYVNPAFERITGYREAEILGRNCRFLQGDDRDQPGIDEIREAIAQKRECRAIVRNYRRDGTLFWNEVFISPVKNRRGEPTHFIGIQSDITERKQAEEVLKRSQTALKKANYELQRLALYDDLTQVANRRRFNEYLDYSWQRSGRDKQFLSLIFCDIDYFKLYNDTFGHQAGDECLKTVAATIAKALPRSVDLVARYGGEEFAIVLPNTPVTGAKQVAERIRQQVENLHIPNPSSKSGEYVTVSLGIASQIPDAEFSLNGFLARADRALYAAKDRGRNVIVIGQSLNNSEASDAHRRSNFPFH